MRATRNNVSVLSEAQRDPAGAAAVALVPILVVLLVVYFYTPQPQPISRPVDKGKTEWIEQPPQAWRNKASKKDLLYVPGYQVAYWGNPKAKYSSKPHLKFRAIVTHYTIDRPALNFVKYGHSYDKKRGGSFGYHFYVDRDGNIYQGAPLSRRTNHVKPPSHKQRRKIARYVSNSTAIGISFVGGCAKTADIKKWRCLHERTTKAQIKAGVAVAQALQKRYGLKCSAVFGHGELQHDRESFEGKELAAAIRRRC